MDNKEQGFIKNIFFSIFLIGTIKSWLGFDVHKRRFPSFLRHLSFLPVQFSIQSQGIHIISFYIMRSDKIQLESIILIQFDEVGVIVNKSQKWHKTLYL